MKKFFLVERLDDVGYDEFRMGVYAADDINQLLQWFQMMYNNGRNDLFNFGDWKFNPKNLKITELNPKNYLEITEVCVDFCAG